MGDATQEQLLVVRSRRGDAGAFATLIDAYERIALSVAYSAGGDACSAGDVVQDAFLRAWQRIGDLQDQAKFGPWLCGIVRNLAIDAARSRAVRAARGLHDLGVADAFAAAADADSNPLECLGRREECQRLSAAIGRLDEISRSAVTLRYYENLSSKQIGELLGIAPTAVDMRLMRARRQLREHLEDEEQRENRHAKVRA